MNITEIIADYNEAVMDQSYPEMKKVAQRLLDVLRSTSVTNISEKFVTYTKYVDYNDSKYQIDVYINSDNVWNWDIRDEDCKLIKWGSDALGVDNEDIIFAYVIDNFANYVE